MGSIKWNREEHLSVHRYRFDGHLVVEAEGEVVLSTTKTLETALRPGEGEDALRVTVDLRRVKFLDSSGLAVLVMASRRLRSHDAPLAPRIVVTPGCQPERVLFLGGFDKILEIARDLGGETMGHDRQPHLEQTCLHVDSA